jgi:hypothetical protein
MMTEFDFFKYSGEFHDQADSKVKRGPAILLPPWIPHAVRACDQADVKWIVIWDMLNSSSLYALRDATRWLASQ